MHAQNGKFDFCIVRLGTDYKFYTFFSKFANIGNDIITGFPRTDLYKSVVVCVLVRRRPIAPATAMTVAV